VGGPFSFVTTVVGSGASAGLAIIAATVLAVDSLRSHTAQSGSMETPFYLLVLGTLAGILAAAFAAWRLLSSVGSSYRRGALSIVCSFATVLLMLVCIPVHQLLGRTGLLLLLGVAALAAVVLAQRARRMGTGQ
jgi:hypothetical protein